MGDEDLSTFSAADCLPRGRLKIFTYQELKKATDGFSDANLLGQGGFGRVYRGDVNGRGVAIKQLKDGKRQGQCFLAEIDSLSNINHKNLVSLVGYCDSESQKLLVYEFVPNKTLEFHLHGQNQPAMEWSARSNIALCIAKGLAYLHEECRPTIIHGDIKAANILLDCDYEAKIADFGLATICFDEKFTSVYTDVMSRLGYLAPECERSRKLTVKSDVFSFGILLLELISGRRPTEKTAGRVKTLIDWARPLLTPGREDGKWGSLIDPRLKTYNVEQMERTIVCAAACLRHLAPQRPMMSKVVRFLEGNLSPDKLDEDLCINNNEHVKDNSTSNYTYSESKTPHW
ncbi:proline-rich receptor-like protein kinase PERK15 [Typha latifolia]|uniref:proline-rich receptor-like protein kinase PERK15 n=1 Tax=Typha latifolia TaxID=4733 RepID=UPI003C2DE4DD